MAPTISRHHAEWLSLVETSGPFVSVLVLSRALPQGLDPPDRDVTARLRAARDQLDEQPDLHRAWCEFVLREVLELEHALVSGPALPTGLEHRVAEHAETLRPDFAAVDRSDGAPRAVLLVTVYDASQRLDRRLAEAAWAASPIDRMAALCRATGVPLGLTTNGAVWALVWARPGETTGVCTWQSNLWLEEPLTLRAFRTLLGTRRFFSVAKEDTLPALLEQSAKSQQEVTDRLGAQVREAVELLIDSLDRADRDRRGTLLGEIANEDLYRAALTVMMRLVFLFVAEERRLLPLDDPFYAESYAASTLREQLEERATRFGEDPLERSSAAWHRLLALFRAVHGGIEHEALRLPAYGGGLFDPDRYPFLEGRDADHGGWRQEQARPLPVDDRTVLHLLTALQVLEEPARAGQPRAAVRLSFRALDVEQIGHVYEGLLDHTAVRTFDSALGVVGRPEEEVALGALEQARAAGEDALLALLKENTAKSESALRNALAAPVGADRAARLLAACDNDPELRDRVLPFLGIVREDLRGNPRVFVPGSLYVTKTLERRASGTYYTPRSLAEEMVQDALDPVVYSPGPAEEVDPAKWQLRPPLELLDIKVADIAMGSGAFLVAACRYLGARLLEAWEALPHERAHHTVFGRLAEPIVENEPMLPGDPAEREVLAHRLIAERCLYGVDKNPMAVEMAKLSLWLITLARDRPFSFLDHALREGDSLLGVTSLDQVRCFHLDPERGRDLHENLLGYMRAVAPAVNRALALRAELESFVVRDIRDARRKTELNVEAVGAIGDVRVLADAVVGAALAFGSDDEVDAALTSVETHVEALLSEEGDDAARTLARELLLDTTQRWMQEGRVDVSIERRCFHWSLELPEVFGSGGFHAVVGNPPFQGGKRITGALGTTYRDHLVHYIADGRRGSADLVTYFVLRASSLLRERAAAGLLATNTIAQGDTREVGLDRLEEAGYTLIRAIPSQPWPGGANLEVAHLWFFRGRWLTGAVLDNRHVAAITPSLQARSRVSGAPCTLLENSGRSHIGVFVNGSGFVLTLDEAEALWTNDHRNREIVKPYLVGQDLNTDPTGRASRAVIDFQNWDLDRAEAWPQLVDILRQRAKPERDKVRRAAYRDHWWRFAEPQMSMRKAISGMNRATVMAQTSKTVMPMFASTTQIFSIMIVVFAYDDYAHFGLLSSGFHYWWAVTHGSTMRTDVRYTPTDCFETFSQPDLTSAVEATGRALDAHRGPLMLDRNEGLTKTYNRVHSPTECAEDINCLRELHAQLDYTVRDAYGWTDLDLGLDFHETRQGIRYTFEPVARQEVLDRLLELNHERYATETAAGLQAKKKAPQRRRRTPASASQTTIFGDA